MEKTWGKNPEYNITVWHNFTDWSLPFGINWLYFIDATGNKCFTFMFTFLCFGFQFEIWRWKNEKS